MEAKKIKFRLPNGTEFHEINEKPCIVSNRPLRVIHLTQTFYEILLKLINGKDFSEVLSSYNFEKKKIFTETLLHLVAKNYLEIYHDCTVPFSVDNKIISVIIPVKNRPEEIGECLKSILDLSLSPEKLEIIVVDDGSTDNTVDVIKNFPVRLIQLSKSQGPAHCRNLGASKASGDILGFVDSDCIVSKDWLANILPYFSFSGVEAVGGRVEGFYKSNRLDHYEYAFSPLDMGKHVLFAADDETTMYVPSCNLFVRKEAFLDIGGFSKGMHVGEDVDFCWRMRQAGHFLLYVPKCGVAHKHRNRLAAMLIRRFEYGTSEGALYRLHKEKKKRLNIPLWHGLGYFSIILALLFKKPELLTFLFVGFFIECYLKLKYFKKYNGLISVGKFTIANLRSNFAFMYFLSFHLLRYYLILIFILAIIFPKIWMFLFLILGICSLVDYKVRKPNVSYFIFLVFYILEHCFYQAGVFVGCLKSRYFSCYVPILSIKVT